VVGIQDGILFITINVINDITITTNCECIYFSVLRSHRNRQRLHYSVKICSVHCIAIVL